MVGAHLSTLSAPAALSFPPSVHRSPLSFFLPRFLSARLVLAPVQRPTFVRAHGEKKARSRRGLKRDRESPASMGERENEREREREREKERERDVTRVVQRRVAMCVCARARFRTREGVVRGQARPRERKSLLRTHETLNARVERACTCTPARHTRTHASTHTRTHTHTHAQTHTQAHPNFSRHSAQLCHPHVSCGLETPKFRANSTGRKPSLIKPVIS